MRRPIRLGFWSAVRDRYGIRSSVAEVRAQAEASQLRRTLGAWQLMAMGVGAIVGVGVFTVTGLVASEYTGPSVAISFVIAALVSVLVALAYAELAALVPVGGSAYTYASVALGELAGWLVAWALVLSYGIGNAAVATGFSDNLSGLLGAFSFPIPETWAAPPSSGGVFDVPAFVVVMLVTVLLLRPVKESASANFALVIVKIATLILFVALGATAVDPVNWTPFAPNGWNGIIAGAGIGFFVFLGFDAVSAAAEETRNPKRDLPIGILGSLAVVVVFYVAVAFVLTGLVPSSMLNTGEPLAFAMREAGFGWAGAVLNVGGLLATLSVLLVFQLATTRIFLAIARDGLFPQWFAKVNARHGTPNRVTLSLGILVALGAAVVPLDVLVALTTEATLFFFALVCVSVVALRRSAPDAPRAFRAPWSPWIPLLGAAACFYLMVTFDMPIHFGFAAWMGLGLMLYAGYGVKNSALRRRMSGLDGAAQPPSGEQRP